MKAPIALLLILASLTLQRSAIAQDQGIESAVVDRANRMIELRFTHALVKVPSVTVTKKVGGEVPVTKVERLSGSLRDIQVTLGMDPGSSELVLRVQSLVFQGGGTIDLLQYSTQSPATERGRIAATMAKIPQTQAERNIFASGFVTASSAGSAGGGDLNLNSIDLGIPNLQSFLQLKRSTLKEGDPKNFELGMRYQTAIPFTNAGTTITAMLIDYAFKSEGTATQFGVNNLVGELAAALQSPVWDLGSTGRAKLRLIGGMEGGSNRSKGDAPLEGGLFEPLRNVDWIARAKYGLETAVYFDNPGEYLPFRKLELRAAAVSRHLYFDELRYGERTDRVDQIARGWRPWAEVDAKLIIGRTDQGDVGVKFTFHAGSLPPIFAKTRAVQFAFIFETRDRTEK